MTSIQVNETDQPRVYQVELDQDGTVTRHRVTVPQDLASLGLPDADHRALVRESFSFLLEHEPPSAILPEFDLTVISRYFPGYPDEISRRMA